MRVLALFLTLASGAVAQPADSTYRVFLDAGEPSSIHALVQAMAEAEVVFLGEQHNDDVAHRLQALLLGAARRYAPDRPLVLSLEMFERDVQGALDEYLVGLIREQDFLAAARPWSNYATDYRPLVEFAREQGLPVVAANAPQRYVSRVSRLGPGSLDSLSATAKTTLPTLPIAEASPALAEQFTALMEDMMAGHGTPHGVTSDSTAAPVHSSVPSLDNLLAAQNLRDASMAQALADALDAHPGALVLHVNGTFHSEGRLGVPEHLARLRPGTRVLIVTMKPDEAFPDLDPSSFRTDGTGFVVVTDPAAQ